MRILPAIDIKDGKCVRLSKGDYSQVTKYFDNPIEVAEKWISQGSTSLHIVDLDGARDGTTVNFDIVKKIKAEFPDIYIQVGGGIRNNESIKKYLEINIDKVIVGTKVVNDPDFLSKINKEDASKLIVDLAVKENVLSVQGWNKLSKYSINEFIEILVSHNVSEIVYTDVSKDGMLEGINFSKIKEVISCSDIPVIASGGVTSMRDISNLLSLSHLGLSGIIIGKALYENTINLSDVIEVTNTLL